MQAQGYSRVPITKRDGTVIAYALVDPEDFEWAMQWPWRMIAGAYAGRTVYNREKGRADTIYLHRALMDLHVGDRRQVDHVNRDRLDNRRENLRIVTPAEQAQNKGSRSDSRSGVRGVIYAGTKNKTNPWYGRVQVAGTVYLSPPMPTVEAAAEWAAEKRAEVMTHAEEAAQCRSSNT